MLIPNQIGAYKARKRLPEKYYAGIGRVVSRFAYLEAFLLHMTYTVLGIDRRQGRLSIRKLRAAEQLALVKDLIKLEGLAISTDWPTITAAMKEVESYRDRLSHCIFIHHPSTKNPVLQDFSAAYIQGLPKDLKTKIEPLAVELKLSQLRAISQNTDQLIKLMEKLEDKIIKHLKKRNAKKKP